MGGTIPTEVASGEDRAILDVAEELYLQLKIPERTGFHARQIEWFEGLAPHQCFIETGIIRLPTSMAGRLQPGDWKPLIASTLIYTYDPALKTGLYPRNAVKVVGIFLVALTLVLAISILLPYSPGRDLVRFIVIVAILPAMMVSVRKPSERLLEGALLIADRKAADLVGRGDFLEVLRKIGSLEPSAFRVDPEMRKPFYPNVMARFPTLGVRIKNLSGVTSE